MVQYYVTCKTELWYFYHGINFSKDNEFLKLGKVLHEITGKHNRLKEVMLGKVKVDLIKKNIIVENKLSQKSTQGGLWQLKYYLYILNHIYGLKFKGKLCFPNSKRCTVINLTDEDIKYIEKILNDISKIIKMDKPPKPKRKPYCRKCAYFEFCWS